MGQAKIGLVAAENIFRLIICTGAHYGHERNSMRGSGRWLGTVTLDAGGSGSILSGTRSNLASLATRTVAGVPEILFDDRGRGPVVVVFPEPGILLANLGICQISG